MYLICVCVCVRVCVPNPSVDRCNPSLSQVTSCCSRFPIMATVVIIAETVLCSVLIFLGCRIIATYSKICSAVISQEPTKLKALSSDTSMCKVPCAIPEICAGWAAAVEAKHSHTLWAVLPLPGCRKQTHPQIISWDYFPLVVKRLKLPHICVGKSLFLLFLPM